MYVSVGAPFEVNISGDARQQVDERIRVLAERSRQLCTPGDAAISTSISKAVVEPGGPARPSEPLLAPDSGRIKERTVSESHSAFPATPSTAPASSAPPTQFPMLPGAVDCGETKKPFEIEITRRDALGCGMQDQRARFVDDILHLFDEAQEGPLTVFLMNAYAIAHAE